MIPAKAKSRPMNLVMRNPLSARKNPPNPGNVEKEQGGAPGIRKLMRNPSQDPIDFSQVRRQENTQTADSWKQEERVESSSSTRTRKVVRQVNTKKEFHIMRISTHQYLTKVFQHLQINLGITAGYSTFAMEAMKTNVLIWGLFMSSSMKAAIRLGPHYTENLEVFKKTNFEEIQKLFNITQKLALEHPEEVLNVNTIESPSPSWTRST